jgi:hypothetical protein
MTEKRSVDDALEKGAVTNVRPESKFEATLRTLAQHGNATAAILLVALGAIGSVLIALLSTTHASAAFQMFAGLVSLAAGYLFGSQSNRSS